MNQIDKTVSRFIPFRKSDVLEMCLKDKVNQVDEVEFRQFYQLLCSVFHFEFFPVSEALKQSYAEIDPDIDTRKIELAQNTTQPFNELLNGLLNKANYERISQQALNQAMLESSLFKIRLEVEFDDFAEVLLFSRGESVKQETVATWFGLSSKTIEFTHYERVVVFLKFKDDLKELKKSSLLNKPGSTLLKLFQNVPKADLEMLFPNTQVRMRLSDKLLIGIPAVISGGVVLTTKLGAPLVILASLTAYWLGLKQQAVEINQADLLVVLAGLGAVGAYLWKQYSNFKNRKLRFLQSLTQNLYFKNLDNNAGVFHRLINDAEEEEVKEALLAYYFLLQQDAVISRQELDKIIEDWFVTQWNCSLNFEIDDALNKLIELQLVEKSDVGLKVVSLSKATDRLLKRWSGYFLK